VGTCLSIAGDANVLLLGMSTVGRLYKLSNTAETHSARKRPGSTLETA
jgi:hypothetical protein